MQATSPLLATYQYEAINDLDVQEKISLKEVKSYSPLKYIALGLMIVAVTAMAYMTGTLNSASTHIRTELAKLAVVKAGGDMASGDFFISLKRATDGSWNYLDDDSYRCVYFQGDLLIFKKPAAGWGTANSYFGNVSPTLWGAPTWKLSGYVPKSQGWLKPYLWNDNYVNIVPACPDTTKFTTKATFTLVTNFQNYKTSLQFIKRETATGILTMYYQIFFKVAVNEAQGVAWTEMKMILGPDGVLGVYPYVAVNSKGVPQQGVIPVFASNWS